MEDILLFFTNYHNNSKNNLTQLFYYETINTCLKKLLHVLSCTDQYHAHKNVSGVGGDLYCITNIILWTEISSLHYSFVQKIHLVVA